MLKFKADSTSLVKEKEMWKPTNKQEPKAYRKNENAYLLANLIWLSSFIYKDIEVFFRRKYSMELRNFNPNNDIRK